MKIIEYSDKEEITRIIQRSHLEEICSSVEKIISDVKENKDQALFELTARFDGFELDAGNIRITEDQIKKAYSNVDAGLVDALRDAHRNIEKFHLAQMEKITLNWKTEIKPGVEVGEKITPIESVGAYVPGGRAAYVSTVLMTCIPPRVAGAKRVVIASPPPISDAILVAADICGVDEIYQTGGAQAIAALAYGTQSIERVDKIVGPGNKYVMTAKKSVYGKSAIDMPAGPSEILIIADKSSKPAFIASDLLAQAEHDPDAQSVLVTDSERIARKVMEEIDLQIENITTRETALKSLEHSYIILTKSPDESAEFADRYAPEHLEIMTADPEGLAEKISNAGAIFLGDYSPVAAGDYASGGNHVLPTSGTARFSSELNVKDFLKTSSIQKITREGLRGLSNAIREIAGSEGFDAHKKSVEVRLAASDMEE